MKRDRSAPCNTYNSDKRGGGLGRGINFYIILILKGWHIMRKNVACMSVEEFLREYIDFLVSHSLSENAAKVYAGKLRQLINSGYSIGDLCGAVESLIKRYGKGGEEYDF